MDVKVLKFSDIGKCPKGSLLPAHYHADGRCKCSEREAADAEIVRARAAVVEAEQQVTAAREWRRST